MIPMFLENFDNAETVFANFEDTTYGLRGKDGYKIEDKDIRILLAYYGYENYEGEAFVLFEKDGELFEVNGGHCSCYGLEGQWSPEETSIEELRHRLTNGDLGRGYWDKNNHFADELQQVLNEWEVAAQ
jgi:hypothetical protein